MEDRITESAGEGIGSTLFDENEMEVCGILLNLGNLVAESELRARTSSTTDSPPLQPFLVRWGGQKRLVCRGGTRRGSTSTTITMAVAGAAVSRPPQEKVGFGTSSPKTPLSFSGQSNTSSESDDKSARRNRNSKKRVLELRKSMEELIESRKVLIKEVANVKSYYDELLADNAKLKAKKLQVLSSNITSFGDHTTTEEKPKLESSSKKSLDVGSNCVQNYQIPVIPNHYQVNNNHGPEELGIMESITRAGAGAGAGAGCGRNGLLLGQHKQQQQYEVGRPNFPVLASPTTTPSGAVALTKVSHPVGPQDFSRLPAAIQTIYGVASSQPSIYCCGADNLRSKAARWNRKMMNQKKTGTRFKIKGVK